MIYMAYIISHHLLLHYVVIYVGVHESIHSDGVFLRQTENGEHPEFTIEEIQPGCMKTLWG